MCYKDTVAELTYYFPMEVDGIVLFSVADCVLFTQ